MCICKYALIYGHSEYIFAFKIMTREKKELNIKISKLQFQLIQITLNFKSKYIFKISKISQGTLDNGNIRETFALGCDTFWNCCGKSQAKADRKCCGNLCNSPDQFEKVPKSFFVPCYLVKKL